MTISTPIYVNNDSVSKSSLVKEEISQLGFYWYEPKPVKPMFVDT